MRVLAVETSGRVGSIAALQVEGEQIATVDQVALPEGQRTAQSLVPEIQQLVRSCDWRPDQLDLICVTTGPGSFTGLRVGVTTAKTLAFASGAKLAEIHTLAAIATGVSQSYIRLWTILDAQRQELFVARFVQGWSEASEGSIKTSIVGIEQWLNELKEGDLVCGPPVKHMVSQLPNGVYAVQPDNWHPQAEIVGRLGVTAFQAKNLVEPMQLVPRYYRKSAAEEKAEQKQLNKKAD